MAITRLSGVAALALGVSGAGAGTILMEFDLSDHPDGSASPPPYGLRLDNIIGSGAATLSMGHFSDTVLSVIEDNGDLSISITGTLWGGRVSGGSYISAEAYTIDMTYALDVASSGGGWVVNGHDSGNSGVLTRVSDNTEWTLYTTTDAGQSFRFLPDGHRLSGDNSSWVGRGWLTTNSDGSDSASGNQDWLFTATQREVPTPGGAAVLALGGVLVSRRRR